jgi:signal transduction histidine kinase
MHRPCAILTEAGLGAALRALAQRSGLAVSVLETPEHRLAGPIEAAAYFVVAESLTNAAKHAAARSITVRARCHAGVLRVEVVHGIPAPNIWLLMLVVGLALGDLMSCAGFYWATRNNW